MIAKPLLQTAENIANNVDASGYAIKTVPGTPVDIIASSVMELPSLEAYDEPEAMAAVVEMNKDSDAFNNCSQYETAMKEQSEKYIPLFQGVLERAHSLVLPVYRSYLERAKNRIDALGVHELLNTDLQFQRIPAIVKDDSFSAMVERAAPITEYNGEGISKPRIAELTTEDTDFINTIISTADRFTSVAIAQWISDGSKRMGVTPVEFIAGLWNETVAVGITRLLENLRGGPVGLDRSIALVLFANALAGSMDRMDGVPLAAANEYLSFIRGAGANEIKRYLQSHNASIKSGKIIEKVIPSTKTLIVNGDVYDDWIKDERNSTDLLLGNLSGRVTARHVASVEEHREQLEMEWNRSVRETESNFGGRKAKVARQVLVDGIVQTLSGFEAYNGNAAEVAEKVNEYLMALPAEKVTNPNDICLDIICNICFKNDDACKILLGINAEHEKDPSLSVNECATLAVINMVTEWVLTQLAIERK